MKLLICMIIAVVIFLLFYGIRHEYVREKRQNYYEGVDILNFSKMRQFNVQADSVNKLFDNAPLSVKYDLENMECDLNDSIWVYFQKECDNAKAEINNN